MWWGNVESKRHMRGNVHVHFILDTPDAPWHLKSPLGIPVETPTHRKHAFIRAMSLTQANRPCRTMPSTHESSTMAGPWRDMICGTVGGMASKIAEHPLDTVKVRLQANPGGFYRGTMHCLGHSMRHDGIVGLYQVQWDGCMHRSNALTNKHDGTYVCRGYPAH